MRAAPHAVFFLLSALFVSLPSCASGGGTIAPAIHQEGAAKGEVHLGSVYVFNLPWTYPIKAMGDGKWVFDWAPPGTPTLTFTGSWEWIIEPINPADAAGLEQHVREGRVRGARLVAPGTIAKMRAGR